MVINPWIRIGMLDPDLDSMNPDPQLCFADTETKSLTTTILMFADLMGL